MRQPFCAKIVLGALGLVGAVATAGVASAQSVTTTAQSTETAALTPGPFEVQNPGQGAAAVLPRPLSQGDADLYADIFALQKDGRWSAADKKIKLLGDNLLLGHVLYQRLMHPTAYRSKYKELKDWMGHYADHPGANKVYALALRRRPSNWRYPIKPQSPVPNDLIQTVSSPAKKKQAVKKPYRTRAQRAEIRTVQRRVRSWVQRGNVTKSLEYVNQARFRKLLDPISFGESLGVIARGYFRYHKDVEAIDVASQALKRTGDTASNAAWWGGLAAYRIGDYRTAAQFFETLSESPVADDDDRAAGAFWASRAYLVGGEPHKVSPLLTKAAEVQRSFYGLLATRALGLEPNFDWALPTVGPAQSDILRRVPAAKRAMALIQVGQRARAESELQRFAHVLPPQIAQILVAMADQGGLADLAYRLGATLERKHGVRLDAAMYPVPGYQPDSGFSIDRAIVYAFIRQESRFRPNVKSRAGARGLMQLMPATAGFVAGRRFSGSSRDLLLDPGLNLDLGQKYINMLLQDSEAGKNLFYSVAAYNAGPGNLQKWRRKIDYSGDPLLFIESLPSRETRNYVEHIFTDVWIYRDRFGQPTPTKDALLGGTWPTYVALDGASPSIRTADRAN